MLSAATPATGITGAAPATAADDSSPKATDGAAATGTAAGACMADAYVRGGRAVTDNGDPKVHAAPATVTESNTAAAERQTVGDCHEGAGSTPHQ
jgi:hypothetical protein